MKIINNFIRNSADIIRLAEYQNNDFKPRVGVHKHESIIPGLCSRFKTLHSDNMSPRLIELIFEYSDFDSFLKDTFSFIQIQKYEKGDFIIPHKDIYDIQKLHLITLTTSDHDGLVIEDGNGGLVKIYDKAGTYIDFDNSLYHWVDPVEELRYSLVIGE